MPHSSKPWWRTEDYTSDTPLPEVFNLYAGPKGVGLVRAYPDGTTDPGWGLDSKTSEGFMPRYTRGEFNARRITFGFLKGKHAFAIIMRSLNLVCIDIDGKNGGFDHAGKLGMLPLTLAETSKSGDGYHLFYSTSDYWDPVAGFGELGDRIGIEQGVDFRGTGCVYHHENQRWNTIAPTPLPPHLHSLLVQRKQQIAATARITQVLASDDPTEVLMLQDELKTDLAKPIPQGKRNQTLFAIGTQMYEGAVPGWQGLLEARGKDIGLDQVEIDKIIANIQRYATASTP